MPPTRFVPEVPHARLAFDAVQLDDGALLPGDGWALYAKPFRTVEDVHVNAAVIGYLVREARRLAWPRSWVARAAALLLALFAEAATHWDATPSDAARARWLRDRDLLNVASTARAQRERLAHTDGYVRQLIAP